MTSTPHICTIRSGRHGNASAALVDSRSKNPTAGRLPPPALILFVFFFAVAVTWVGVGYAARPAWFSDDPTQPWKIAADEITHNRQKNQYSASGNVVISKTGRRITADRIEFNRDTMTILAEGHIVMTAGNDILTGSRMEINLKSETGYIVDGTIFAAETQFRVAGDRIEKTGPAKYAITGASVTTCDGDTPAWRITCDSLDVTVEGYGVARGAAFWIRSVPVFYSPYMAFPVKLERQTGLLIPQFSVSERKGIEFNQPLFWAINRETDATFYWHHMQDRGEKIGAEYRYMASDRTFGTIMADGFEDRKIDDGTPDNTRKWGYPDDDYIRTNTDRYWFRMKNDVDFGTGKSAKVDMDLVSDQDYLKEFQEGYTGWNETNSYYTNVFGRGVDGEDDPVRLNLANFNKRGAVYSFNADLRWHDNVINRRQDLPDATLQEMPRIDLSGSRRPIKNTPLFFDGVAEYVHFYRQDGQTGHRVDLYPRAYWPMNYRHYVTVEPSAGIRETLWTIDRQDPASSGGSRTHARPLYDLRLDTNTEVFRVFSSPFEDGGKLRHIMRPQVIYEYIPNQDQSDLPSFDSTDRIEPANRFTYLLINTLTARSATSRRKDTADTLGATGYDYHQFLRFQLEQSYDINEAGTPDPRPFSPIFGLLQLDPRRYLTMRADGNWSVYDKEFLTGNFNVGLWNNRGDRLFVEYRYDRAITDSIYTRAQVEAAPYLTAYGAYERNLRDDADLRREIGFLFKRQCWSIDLRYTDEILDRSITFQINLNGLGGLGTGFDPTALSGSP